MLPHKKASDGSLFDIGLAFQNVLIPEKIRKRGTKKEVIEYPQHDVDEAVTLRLIPFFEKLQEKGILIGLIGLFEHMEIEILRTSCDEDRSSGRFYCRELRNTSLYLHLKFNDDETSKVFSVSDLLQQYCAEETIESESDINTFHSLYQHENLPGRCITKKRIDIQFANSKLVLLHINFILGDGRLTTNKISIMESRFIKDSLGTEFALVGFLVHEGSISSGHYIAYVVDADHVPLQWVSFDDLEGVNVVINYSSFFENITSDTSSSHVCLLIYGENSSKLCAFHSKLETKGNFDYLAYLYTFFN
jgi:hypothetical protein